MPDRDMSDRAQTRSQPSVSTMGWRARLLVRFTRLLPSVPRLFTLVLLMWALWKWRQDGWQAIVGGQRSGSVGRSAARWTSDAETVRARRSALLQQAQDESREERRRRRQKERAKREERARAAGVSPRATAPRSHQRERHAT
eukprot:ctg_459.g149